MAEYKPQRNLRINDELYLKVKKIADRFSRSFNKQAEFVLKEFVSAYEEQNGKIDITTDMEKLYE